MLVTSCYHHSKYWMPIHYDTIKDGKTKNLIFYFLSVQWVNPLSINAPSVEKLRWISHRGSVDFKWSCPMCRQLCNRITKNYKTLFHTMCTKLQTTREWCCALWYTPVHLVESVENCGLCMRWYLVCSSYANVMHRELAIMRALRYDANVRD